MDGILVVITLTLLRFLVPVSALLLLSTWLRQKHPAWF
jgi:hypothetical protein